MFIILAVSDHCPAMVWKECEKYVDETIYWWENVFFLMHIFPH